MDKDALRLETNKLVISTVQDLIENEGLNAEWIVENLDEFTRSCMATGCVNASVSTKFSKFFQSDKI